VLGYTRRQIILLLIVVAIGAGGLTIDRWRRANPDVVAYLETLDRAAPPSELAPRRVSGRVRETAHAALARQAHDGRATPVDLNLASAAELERLPGVSPALAARIVDARERDGPFGSVDDLRRVRGLRRTTLERLRPWLAVNTP